MNLRRRIVAGIEDIKAVALECDKCHDVLLLSPDSCRLPEACQCGHPWRLPGIMSANYKTTDSTLVRFIEAIPIIRTLMRERPLGFRITLEFDELNDSQKP